LPKNIPIIAFTVGQTCAGNEIRLLTRPAKTVPKGEVGEIFAARGPNDDGGLFRGDDLTKADYILA